MIENEGPQDHTEENRDTDSQPESGQTGGCRGATANWKTLVPFKGVTGTACNSNHFPADGNTACKPDFCDSPASVGINSKLLSSLVLKAVGMGVRLGWTHPPAHNYKV